MTGPVSVATDTDGRGVVAWESGLSDGAGGDDVRARVRTIAGSWSPMQIVAEVSHISGGPAVALDGSGALIAWTDAKSPPFFRERVLRARTLSPAGELGTVDERPGFYDAPVIVRQRNGYLAVAVVSMGIGAVPVDDDGSLGEPRLIARAGNPKGITAAPGPNGDTVIAWSDDQAIPGGDDRLRGLVKTARIDPGGRVVGPIRTLPTSEPDLAGPYLVGNANDALVGVLDLAGITVWSVTFPSPQPIVDLRRREAHNLVIAIDGEGTGHLVWIEGYGDRLRLHAQRVGLEPRVLAEGPGFESLAITAWPQREGAVVAWAEWTDRYWLRLQRLGHTESQEPKRIELSPRFPGEIVLAPLDERNVLVVVSSVSESDEPLLLTLAV